MAARPPRYLILAALIILPLGIFALDMHTALGMADWIWYVLPLLLSGYLNRRWLPFLLAAIFSVLTVAGFFLAPPGIDRHIAQLNRIIGIMVLWLVAFIEFKRLRAQIQLRESEARLNTLFKILPAGISIVGEGRKFLKINPALEDLLEISPTGL